jgi:hypothetical protein
MTAKEWLGIMKQAKDFPKGMEDLIVKYGEMILDEYKVANKNFVQPDVISSVPKCKCDNPVIDSEDSSICGNCGDDNEEHY